MSLRLDASSPSPITTCAAGRYSATDTARATGKEPDHSSHRVCGTFSVPGRGSGGYAATPYETGSALNPIARHTAARRRATPHRGNCSAERRESSSSETRSVVLSGGLCCGRSGDGFDHADSAGVPTWLFPRGPHYGSACRPRRGRGFHRDARPSGGCEVGGIGCALPTSGTYRNLSRSRSGQCRKVEEAKRVVELALGDAVRPDHAPVEKFVPMAKVEPIEVKSEAVYVLSLGEVAARLHISRAEVERMIAAGK